MKYTAGCIGKNGKEYAVEIITNNDATATKELTLVAGGLVVRVDANNDLFAPLRGCSASITVRTDKALTDLYSDDAMGVSVAITEDSELLFLGYVMPCMYSQPMGVGKSEITIECRDALSVLQELKFDLEQPSATFVELLQAALDKVDVNAMLALNYANPFTVSLDNLAVSVANWYDESGDAMMWSEVLAGILQWAGLRIIQWRNAVIVSELSDATPTQLDEISANAVPTMSLTEVKKKCKISVSLYEEGDKILDAFEGWEMGNTEEYYQSAIKGVPNNWNSYLAFYSAPNITQFQYDSSFNSSAEIVNTGDALSKKFGAWLIAQSSGEFKQSTESDKNEELEDYNEAKKYIALASPKQKTSWRGTLLDASNAPKYPAITIKDSVSRVYTSQQLLVFNVSAWMTTNPSPVICRKLKGEYFNGITGKTDKYTTDGAPSLQFRVRIGDKELAYVSGGTPGWNEDKTDPSYTVRIGLPLAKKAVENPFDKTLNNIDTLYQYHIASKGFAVYLADGCEGQLEVDIMLNTGDKSAEYAFIEDFSVSLGSVNTGTGAAITKLLHDLNEIKDVEYESEGDDDSELYEITNNVSTKASAFKYARSTVYENTGGYLAPVGELESAHTDDVAIAEHHLLNKMVKQMSTPRTKLDGTWRNHVGNPLKPMYSEAMGKLFLVEALEIDCDNSTSTMTLEEIIT